jgi:hypothetical protein
VQPTSGAQSVILDLLYAEARYQYALLRKLGKPAKADAQPAAFHEVTAKEPPRNRR